MDRSEQQQQPVAGTSAAQITYATPPYLVSDAPAVAVPSSTQPAVTFSTSQNQVAYQQAQHLHHQQQQLQVFWANQIQEIEQTTDFKNHSLPLARIKKIMKADEDVRMIAAEAPVVFAKACEIFILELTLRAWIHTEENKRRTLQKNDIAAAVTRTDIFDFLVDIVPRDELKEGLGIPQVSLPVVGAPSDSIPYYYVPPHNQVGAPGMIMGKPVDQAAAVHYASQQPHPPVCHGHSLSNHQPSNLNSSKQMPDGG